jgi:hypothetical protein
MHCVAFSYPALVLATVLLCAQPGCAGEQPDPDPVADVPGDARYAALSDEDRERVCAELDQRVQSDPVFLEGRCAIFGALRAYMEATQGAISDVATACEMYSAQCVTAEQHYRACGTVVDYYADSGVVVEHVDGPSSCEATVGDFSRCTDARLETFRQRSMLSCDELIASLGARTALCEHIDDHCLFRVVGGSSAP